MRSSLAGRHPFDQRTLPQLSYDTVSTLTLFENDGTNWYRIPSLIATPGGTLIATCDQRKGSFQDHGQDTDVVMRRSTDGGATWEPGVTLATKPGATLHSGPSLIDEKTGRVFKFYRVHPCVKTHRELFEEMRDRPEYWLEWGGGNFVIHSDDDGATWSPPRRLDFHHPDETTPARIANSVHGIQMRDGILLVPASCSCADRFEHNTGLPSRSFLLVSEDGGETWYIGATWSAGYAQMEFTIAETRDGRVYVNQRSLGPHRRVLWIDDFRCNHATLREEPQLPEPVCHAGLHRIGDDLFFANPRHANHTGKYAPEPRRDLALWRSHDDGQTWSEIQSITQTPSGYIDLATAPGSARAIACLYECGDEHMYDRIDFAMLPTAS